MTTTRRAHPLVTSLLVVAALAALVLVVALMLGGSFSWRVLGLRVRLNNIPNAMIAGAALSAALLYYAWPNGRLRALGVTLLALSGLLALIVLSREAQQFVAVSDLAVIESDTLQAIDGRVFLGPYSRFGWHHPGPLYFYVLAPFYALSDYRTSGLAAGALAINLAAIVAIAWVSLREQSGALAVMLTAATVYFVWRFGGLFASAWNPHVLVLPTLALVVVCASIVNGRLGLLPLAAAFASFVGQTHVGLVPTALTIVGASVAAAVARAYLNRTNADTRRFWRAMNVTMWTLVVLWLLPLAEAVYHTGGNMALLWSFFVDNPASGQPLGTSIGAWADALTGAQRVDFRLAWGNLLTVSPPAYIEFWAVGQVVLLAVLAIRGGRGGFHRALCAMLCLSSVIAFWSVTRIREELFDHETFWMAGLGVLNAAVIVEAFLGLTWRRIGRISPRAVYLACGALMLIAALLGTRELMTVNLRTFRTNAQEDAARSLSEQVLSYIRAEGWPKTLIRIDGAAWAVAAGVVVQLQKSGIPFSIENSWLDMYNEAFRSKGDEAGTVIISARGRYVEPGRESDAIVIAGSRGFFAHAVPARADLAR